MARLPNAAKIVNDLSQAPADAGPQPEGAIETLSAGSPPGSCSSRGVLDCAFPVLDALAHADNGLGLSALACASGLAKTSAYRLAEQLVSLGAVQRVDQRYYVGARIGRIGQRWQPSLSYAEQHRRPYTRWRCSPARWRRCGFCTRADFA